MKKLIILSFVVSFNIMASNVWTAGNLKVDLVNVKDQGIVSKSCEKKCKLSEVILKNKEKLKEIDVSGGKDPASGMCKAIGAQVTYFERNDHQEPFCVLDGDMISLSLLLRDL